MSSDSAVFSGGAVQAALQNTLNIEVAVVMGLITGIAVLVVAPRLARRWSSRGGNGHYTSKFVLIWIVAWSFVMTMRVLSDCVIFWLHRVG
jgi:hypothetical protein